MPSEEQREQRWWLYFMSGHFFFSYFEPEFSFVLLLLIGPLEDLFVYVGKMDGQDQVAALWRKEKTK